MISENWDVSHICIAVTDLEAAREQYARAFGMDWSPIMDFPAEFIAGSDVLENGVSHEGLRVQFSRNGGPAKGGVPSTTIELACAEKGSPADAMWGCPAGVNYFHHVAFWVDDIEAESKHMIESGFPREMNVVIGGASTCAYHTKDGTRIELWSEAMRAPTAQFLATGEFALD
jgi:catechol 2,3-dioxygenase-like lactoylglutathione lyase family enzyme